MLRRLAALDPARYPLLLDSAAAGPLGTTTVLLAAPRAALWLGADGRLGADGTAIDGDTFLAALESWWRREGAAGNPEEMSAQLPFTGGWALYLGYELAQEIEPRLALPRTPLPWVAYALRTPGALIHELGSGRVLAVCEAGSGDTLELIVADAYAAAAQADPP
ncbi:MAG TPA: hypothetical protein VM713_07085, partial [Steroidobacteraceae bacterium]|nr:hypothetical protein [Steroidobacteraceae bacterium]